MENMIRCAWEKERETTLEMQNWLHIIAWYLFFVVFCYWGDFENESDRENNPLNHFTYVTLQGWRLDRANAPPPPSKDSTAVTSFKMFWMSKNLWYFLQLKKSLIFPKTKVSGCWKTLGVTKRGLYFFSFSWPREVAVPSTTPQMLDGAFLRREAHRRWQVYLQMAAQRLEATRTGVAQMELTQPTWLNLLGMISLPETNSSHLNMDGWKISFLLG